MLAELETPVIVSRWFHLASVIVAVGGTVFLRFVLHPLMQTALAPEARDGLRDGLVRRWGRFLHVLIGVIILTGTYNAIVQFGRHKVIPGEPPVYHIVFGIKLLLALVLFFIAIAVTGRSAAFEGMRKRRPMWLAVSVLLAAAILLLSNVLKSLPPS